MCVHKETGAQRAVKVINKSELDEDELKMFLNEVKIVKTMVLCFYYNQLIGSSKHSKSLRNI